MVKKDGYLFVGCSSGIFNVYDISIPGSPQRVFSDYLGGSDIYDISRQGNLVFLACRNMGMQIIDITNPLEPVLVGDFVNHPYSFETMAIRNNLVCLASTKGMIYILDTTQPDAIVKKDSIDIGRDIKSVALLNDYLYVANDDSFLHVINVADDNAPVIETQIPVQNRPSDLVVFESFLYLWTGGDLNVYDVSIPHAPELVTTTLQSSGRSLFFDYPYLYLTTYSRGLWMLDVTDPMNIERVGVYDTYGAPWDGYAEGDYVYLADQRDGIYIFQNDRKVAGVTGERQSIPKEFTLEQPYPNPFNSSVKIDFVLHRTEHIRLFVYNYLGQVVRTLVDRQLSPGKHTVHWQGLDDANTNVASGVYVVRMELKDEQVMKKILLLR
jgi:hypothetical protein